jgi:hypothetical protein
MTPTIIAKSDQLNADDLVGGPITVTITKVDVRDAKEQPVTVHYQGDNGKPYKPCKSMCRVMVAAWGPDSKSYPGKSMTLYREPSVKWAGMEIGGIRIKAMSHIEGVLLTSVTLAKGSKKPYRVEPLEAGQGHDNGARETADDLIRRAEACDGPDALKMLAARDGIIKRREWLRDVAPDLADKVDAAFAPGADTVTEDNPTAAEGPAEDDRGEAHVEDETPAWRVAVDAHLARLADAQALHGVHQAILDFEESLKGLPDDVRQEVNDAEHNAQMRFSTATGG